MTTPNILFNINGQPQPVGDLTFSLLDDRGLAYGHGLFESMVLTDSTIPLLDRHLSRLIHDSQLMGISVGNDDIDHYLKVFLETLSAQAITSGIVKIILTAGSGGRGYAMPTKIVPTLIYSYTPMPENVTHQRDQGVDIRLCRHLLGTGSTLAGVKHLNRLDQVMARSEWSHNRYQDGLMFTKAGDVIEATSANIFVKTQDGQWLTPDLDQSGVSGVMRGLLIEEVFPACDIRVSIKAINRDTLLGAQQILLCNSLRGILRVNSVYSNDDQLLMTLPLDQQSLMLSQSLIKLYPQYR
jgi:4-amino-4-deoxychorismate lyase